MELYNANCLDKLQEMIDQHKTVDCIITSPPYNMNLRIHSGKYMSRWGWKGNIGSFSTKYNNYHDDLPMEEYFKFQDEFIDKALKITDLMFYNIQMITGNKVALFQLFGKYAEKIKEIIIWNKGYGQPAMQVGTFVGVKNPSNFKLPEETLNVILALLANVDCIPSHFERAVASRLRSSFRTFIKKNSL